MNILKYALRVEKNQTLNSAVSAGQHGILDYYLDEAGCYELDTVLLVPAYRLEEVEEVIEPEKPGVPVEPYVGLTWKSSIGRRRIVLSVNETHYELLAEDSQRVPSWTCVTLAIKDPLWNNYPHTPSTPAVTRKVKKWVKIVESPEC